MDELMAAVAATLRNLGIEATHGSYYVEVNRIRFEASCRYNRKSFEFLGRSYRTGNTMQATLDLLKELPRLEERRLQEIARQQRIQRVQELSRQYAAYGITIRSTRNGFCLTFESDDIESLAAMADSIAKRIDAASEAEWQNLISSAPPSDIVVRFTAEGGFSLN